MTKNKFLYICLFVALICFIIAGCASFKAQTNRIEIGMTKQQVTNIMGQPLDRTFSGNTETWYYRRASLPGPWSQVWIYFTDGRVSSMRTDN